jgi:hypothetical protein
VLAAALAARRGGGARESGGGRKTPSAARVRVDRRRATGATTTRHLRCRTTTGRWDGRFSTLAWCSGGANEGTRKRRCFGRSRPRHRRRPRTPRAAPIRRARALPGVIPPVCRPGEGRGPRSPRGGGGCWRAPGPPKRRRRICRACFPAPCGNRDVQCARQGPPTQRAALLEQYARAREGRTLRAAHARG